MHPTLPRYPLPLSTCVWHGTASPSPYPKNCLSRMAKPKVFQPLFPTYVHLLHLNLHPP
jgi:hypothetical protein